MEAEARSELEEARNRVRELESRSGDMESQRNMAGEQQAEMSRRAEDAGVASERARSERRMRSTGSRKEQEANLTGSKSRPREQLEGHAQGAGSKEGEVAELRRQADEAKAAAFKAEQSLGAPSSPAKSPSLSPN